jgi:hypothetical protein
MSSAAAFDWTCQEIERLTSLDTLEARGTVRLALKEAGLDARSASPHQISVVVDRILVAELQARGIDNADQVCESLAISLKSQEPMSGTGESPEEVFKRLGGS